MRGDERRWKNVGKGDEGDEGRKSEMEEGDCEIL